MKIVLCDVCRAVIVDQICPECRYDNSDQFYIRSRDLIYEFIDKNNIYSEDILIESIIDRFGLDPEEAENILDKYLSEENDAEYVD